MTPLTVACVWVRGEYPYTVEYVTRLRAMVARWIDRPFRFVCLTDRPGEMPDGVAPILVTKLAGFAPWTKLELFNPINAWTGQRVLYLDLDSLIVAPLAPIIDVPAPFAITADPPVPGQRQRDSFGRQIVRRFNSSVMVWDGGTQTDLYTEWTPAVSARLSGDQDFIAGQRPGAATLPRAWFPRLSEAVRPPWSPDAKVILVKVPKNHIVAQEQPWFGPLWGSG
jgi:hypothetical protein